MASDPRRQLGTGDEVAGASLRDALVTGERINVFHAELAGGGGATVHVLAGDKRDREERNFVKGAQALSAMMKVQRFVNVVEITAVAEAEVAYVARGSVQGTMGDVRVLGWGVSDTVRFIRKVARAVGELHNEKLIHGCLRPANVLLGDELEPRLSDVGMLVIDDSYDGPSDMKHDYSAYAAREVRLGQPADERSDVFSVGRLLYFALVGAEPDESDEEVPRLAALKGQPVSLVRIIRRCTLREPASRYGSMHELLVDLKKWDSADNVGTQSVHDIEAVEVDAEEEGKPTDTASRGGASDTGPPAAEAEGEQPHDALQSATFHHGPKLTPNDVLTPEQARIGVFLGAVALCGGLLLAYMTAMPLPLANAALVVGAIGVSMTLPVFGGLPILSRIVSATVLSGSLLFADPVAGAAELGRRAKLTRGQLIERSARVQQLAQRGFRDFRNLDFSGIDLASSKLGGVWFDGSRLRDANFRNARLGGAIFVGTELAGADFAGADLRGTDMNSALGWVHARCDGATSMPDGWTCTDDGNPASLSSGLGEYQSAGSVPLGPAGGPN